jgi:ribulose-5-phosphate 4-epimerase/fuculose-1-phosphate aldolase
VASGGNLSVREPGSDQIWITAAASWLDRLDEGTLVRLNIDEGAAVDGCGVNEPDTGAPSGPARPSTEAALHLATYRARPDVNAVIHLHPQMAILLDALGQRIRLVTTDHRVYLRDIARTPFHPPGSTELAAVAAAAAADGANCVLLAHHGCSVLGPDLDMAYRRAVNLDEAARLTYHALVLTGGLPGRSIEECPSLPSAAELI